MSKQANNAPLNAIKDKWRKGMEEYCNEEANGEYGQNTGWCTCVAMPYCKYCDKDNKNCVTAIEKYAEAKGVEIDYTETDYYICLVDILRKGLPR